MTDISINCRASGLERRIENDTFPPVGISEIYEANYKQRIYDARLELFSTQRLKNKVDYWRQDVDGVVVVLTSGVYDLLHHNHKGYLLHTKLAGLPLAYSNQTGKDWNQLQLNEQAEFAKTALTKDFIKLIVSVDGDKSVSVRKGNNPNKGGGARPITAWESRARSVADVTVPLGDSPDQTLNMHVANAVTVHGPNDFEPEHTNHNLLYLAEYLQPDVWSIYEESQDIIQTAPYVASLGSIALRVIPVEGYFEDFYVGDFSTTAILKRAKGDS